MEITGIIEKVLPLEAGITKAGKDWQKQNFIVANNEGYNDEKQIFCFEIFGEEKVENFNKYNKAGDNVKVDFNISTNEWKDKYYTSLQAWKVFKAETDKDDAPSQNYDVKNPTYEKAPALAAEEPDDLPF